MRNQLMILFYVASIILSVNFLKAQQRQEMRQDVGGLKLFIEEFPKEFKMLLPWFTKDAVPASLIEAKDYINGKKKTKFSQASLHQQSETEWQGLFPQQSWGSRIVFGKSQMPGGDIGYGMSGYGPPLDRQKMEKDKL